MASLGHNLKRLFHDPTSILVVCDTFASLFVVVVVDVDVSNMFYTLYTGKSIHTVYNFILSVFSHITHLPL